ncbi:MAG: ZPR1 zinc finger domain-containing protein [Desulfurococcaceae archaeon]
MCCREVPEKLAEYTSKCPLCGYELRVLDYKYSIAYYGDVIISTAECPSCGFKHRDVLVLGKSNPRKIVYRVEEPGDENALLVKSSTCKIEIPELGLTVEPGISSQGYITTIEGLILDFIYALNYLCEQEDAPRDKCSELSSLLGKAKNAEVKYTVIVYDSLGVCDIIGKKEPAYEELNV